MKVIINRGKKYGTVDSKLTTTEDLYKLVNMHLKSGTAELLVDTDETLMYLLRSQDRIDIPIEKNEPELSYN